MKYGISLYPGLEGKLAESLSLLDVAAKHNINQLFLSFNLPEINRDNFKNDFFKILNSAKALGFNIISDLSPSALSIFDMSTVTSAGAASLGLNTLRLDFGFTPAEISHLSHNHDKIKIQLNASTITVAQLAALKKANADFSQITALHNFYPREYTGLSESFFLKQTKLLQSFGIEVYAFVASKAHKRKPICAGLPSLELHRTFSVSLAARHLAALGVDGIFIGDSFPSDTELQQLSAIKANCLQLTVQPLVYNDLTKDILTQTFTSRPDKAENVIRAEESRDYIRKCHYTVEPQNNILRSIGAVTLDNKDYLRYMGELQIIKHELPADKRSNVIAQIASNEIFLLSYLTPGQKFSFLVP